MLSKFTTLFTFLHAYIVPMTVSYLITLPWWTVLNSCRGSCQIYLQSWQAFVICDLLWLPSCLVINDNAGKTSATDNNFFPNCRLFVMDISCNVEKISFAPPHMYIASFPSFFIFCMFATTLKVEAEINRFHSLTNPIFEAARIPIIFLRKTELCHASVYFPLMYETISCPAQPNH